MKDEKSYELHAAWVACPREEIERMQEIIQAEYPFLAEKCRIPREEIVKIERIWQRWRM